MYLYICILGQAHFAVNDPIELASEGKSGLRYEISDLDYLHIHVHIALCCPLSALSAHGPPILEALGQIMQTLGSIMCP